MNSKKPILEKLHRIQTKFQKLTKTFSIKVPQSFLLLWREYSDVDLIRNVCHNDFHLKDAKIVGLFF